MCDKSHRYTIEIIGETPRYAGTDAIEALRALAGVAADDRLEGYAVAEHDLGDSTSYCRIETERIENEALAASMYPEDYPELFRQRA